MYIDVSFPISSYQVFSYHLPEKYKSIAQIGLRVRAPLGKKIYQGIIINIDAKLKFKGEIKEIIDIVDDEPVLDKNLWKLVDWMSRYYKTPIGLCAKTILPQNLNSKYEPQTEYFVKYHSGVENFNLKGKSQKLIFNYLYKFKSDIIVKDLNHLSFNPLKVCKKLEQEGYVNLFLKEKPQNNLNYIINDKKKKINFNVEQKKAIEKISNGINTKKFNSILLHGVTGSGKTEIYIEAAKRAIKKGKTVILLLPEITLTPQITGKFKSAFGDLVAIWHSKLTPSVRAYNWKNICLGKYKVIIGARSAIFAPIKDLGLIIIDEEHENSYKQEHPAPRYHARDIALIRGKISDATVILGSATPSLESFYNQLCGKSEYIQINNRYGDAKLPKVQLINMIDESKESFEDPFSKILKEKIIDRLYKKEQIMLLHNRRGFSPVLQCLDCGEIENCSNCHTSLTYHKIGDKLQCHLCGFFKKGLRLSCIHCNGQNIKLAGAGTQKIEEKLLLDFPKARIARLDVDIARSEKNIVKIIDDFSKGNIDILIGTQMIAKGLDFPNVTLVGIINADIGLFLPDFRAGEKTFQLIYQAAGRSGRGNTNGEVIVQSYNSNDSVIKLASDLNLLEYYNQCLADRKSLNYPPYSWMTRIEFKSKKRDLIESAMNFINSKTKSSIVGLHFLGPAFCYREKLSGYHRAQLIIKSEKKMDQNGSKLDKYTDYISKGFMKEKKFQSIRVIIDKNPISLL